MKTRGGIVYIRLATEPKSVTVPSAGKDAGK
jgi:hypothetical protein